MRIKFRLGAHKFLFFFKHLKVRDAVGIKSGHDENHLLLMDFDVERGEFLNILDNLIHRFPEFPLSIVRTSNGYHAIVWHYFSFKDACRELVSTPQIDLSHVAIGIKRRYWFLETKKPVSPALAHTEFMVIERTV